MSAAAAEVQTKPTKAYDDQKAGTSGLRKKTSVFLEKENYLHNFIQSLFDAMEQLGDKVQGQTIGLGGDGRYFNIEAAQIILKLAAGNGIKKVLVGQNGLMATPAMSALIRRRKLYGGLIMSASHNPAGKDGDWGVKFNYKSGEPAPEKITNKVYEVSKSISQLKMLDMPDVDLSKPGTHKFGDFEVEVISITDDYFATLQEVFDFEALKKLVSRSDFSIIYDAMWAVTAAYAKPLFVDMLGCKESVLRHAEAKDDFGGGHPDPNLTYAKELVDEMWDDKRAADFAAASDGDGDRNMILGRKFFITPSDSVAMIAANAQESIPYFKGGLKGVARSMPTSTALGKVAEKLGVPNYEVPTGWKFFGNLMDADKCSVCGEESFGTSSDHVREKDGLWAVLAWLSILAHKNKDVPEGSGKVVGVEDVAMEHWRTYGRNFFMRYDYEGVESDKANKVIETVQKVVDSSKKGDKIGDFELDFADDFEYNDPIDGSVASNQGLRLVMKDGSRIVFRLSGTGSSGATIRMYIEQYSSDESSYGKDAKAEMEPIIRTALELSQLREHTGRDEPTVIT